MVLCMATPLKEKQEAFAQLLAEGKDAASAYITAGYRPNQPASSKLARSPKIVERVEEILSRRQAIQDEVDLKVATKLSVSKQWVMAMLRQTAERCLETKPLLDKHGKFSGRLTHMPSAGIRALELLGKEMGMFIDRKDVRMLRLEDLTQEQLYGFLAELQSRAEENDRESDPGRTH